LDSELIVRQLNGRYRVKDAKIIPLHARARRLMGEFEDVHVTHVRRDRNHHADKLVNAALDAHAAQRRLDESS
jgi:ribonuclease HI